MDRKGTVAGLAVMLLLAGGIVLGSRNLRHYDPILLTYTFGTLFAAFAVAYRYAVWLQRPPTALYMRRGWEFVRRGNVLGNLRFAARAAYENLLAQRFIRKRSFVRWLIHFSIAWGTLLALAVTFPLVFGWLHFASDPDRPEIYRVLLFGLQIAQFNAHSIGRFVIFNLLNVSAVMVIVGAGLSLHRRLGTKGSAARQQFGNDIVPLLLLLAISVTGLLLTFSMHALGGAGYPVLSLVHAVTVSATLLYIPFGKFFHIFQRPAHLAVILYRREGQATPKAVCGRCGTPFASALQVTDLARVLEETGFRLNLELCPACKRRQLGLAQAVALRQGPAGPSGLALLEARPPGAGSLPTASAERGTLESEVPRSVCSMVPRDGI
jgi:hypothetical protein